MVPRKPLVTGLGKRSITWCIQSQGENYETTNTKRLAPTCKLDDVHLANSQLPQQHAAKSGEGGSGHDDGKNLRHGKKKHLFHRHDICRTSPAPGGCLTLQLTLTLAKPFAISLFVRTNTLPVYLASGAIIGPALAPCIFSHTRAKAKIALTLDTRVPAEILPANI